MKITARACRASERTGRLPACCLVRGRRSTTSREFREVGQSRKDKEKKTVCLFDKKTANSLRHRLGRFAGGVPAASAPVPTPAATTAAATASCAVGSTAAASTHSASGTTAKASLFSFFEDSTSLPFASTTGVQRSTSGLESTPRIHRFSHLRTRPVSTCACVRAASLCPRVDIGPRARRLPSNLKIEGDSRKKHTANELSFTKGATSSTQKR